MPAGSVLISLKLSELLEVTSGDQAESASSRRVRQILRERPSSNPHTACPALRNQQNFWNSGPDEITCR